MVLRLFLILRVKKRLTTLCIVGWTWALPLGLTPQAPPATASGSGVQLDAQVGFLCLMGQEDGWQEKLWINTPLSGGPLFGERTNGRRPAEEDQEDPKEGLNMNPS